MKSLSPAIILVFCVLISTSCLKSSVKTENTQKEENSIPKTLISHLEIIDVETGKRTKIYSSSMHFEGPNWTQDGKYFIINKDGKLFRMTISGDSLTEINTDFANHCNNDHLISPDGKQLAISHHATDDNLSKIYIMPLQGGKPRLITPQGPSYLHGWSPDGKTLVYCAERDHNYDVYSKEINGTSEVRLTNAPGLDDGPEFSPDGKHIYFNSVRTGTMQIWRMNVDGSNQTQITTDDSNDWFPHISPDNEKIIYLSYENTIKGHPANKKVSLKLMSKSDYKPTVLATIFGGQGTINVNSWSPDSKKVAFISYEMQ